MKPNNEINAHGTGILLHPRVRILNIKQGDDMERWELTQKQSLPLSAKIRLSERRIRDWYEHWNGDVYVSFSGGKDSTVLLHLVRSIYKDVPAVFVDTGLEYPEIREFVKTFENVTWMKPKMRFDKVVEKYGYPVVSKKQADYIGRCQRTKNPNVLRRHTKGQNSDGTSSPASKISNKWQRLISAPFKVSDKCCNIMKKEPLNRYVRETGRHPMTGTMASESNSRLLAYLSTGCNVFNGNHQISKPLSVWDDNDIWQYIEENHIQYSKIYDMGEPRTGCMFCMFGVQHDSLPNRFQRMKQSHHKQWDYCVNKLGCGEVLDYIGVPYQ